MATFKVLSVSKPYLTLRVTVDGVVYDQQIITELEGEALQSFLQYYADDYELGLMLQKEAAVESLVEESIYE